MLVDVVVQGGSHISPFFVPLFDVVLMTYTRAAVLALENSLILNANTAKELRFE